MRQGEGDILFKQILFYTYNPFYQYFVTPASLEKRYNDDLGKAGKKYRDLFQLLDDLRYRKVTGHTAIQAVNDFVYEFEQYKDLIYKIIGKDLEIRMGDSLINKIIPNLIPTFDCALAANFEDVDVDFVTDKWFASRKLDGCRCLVIVNSTGNVSCWSRQGNQFETLEKVEQAVKKMSLKSVVFDGEICLVDDVYSIELETGQVLNLSATDIVKTSNGEKKACELVEDDILLF